MRKRREEAKNLKEAKPEDAPLSLSPRKMINTLGTDLNLFLLLMLPLVAVPFIIKHFRPSDEQAAYSLTVFCNTFYILLATIYGLIVGLLLKTNSPKIKYSLLMSALLYGQTSFLCFLIVNIDLNPIRIFLLFISVVFLIVLHARCSYNLMLILGIIYFFLVLDSVVDYYFRIYFNTVDLNLFTIIVYNCQTIFWIGNCACAILIVVKNKLRPSSYAPSLKYASGVAVLLVIVTFAHLFQNISLFTNGNAFDYSNKAIHSQFERNLAKEFPALPSRVYENLIKDYENPEKHWGLIKMKDYISGIEQYIPPKNDSIGTAWADFYKERLKAEGATHFRIVKHTNPVGLNENSNAYDLLLYDLSKSNQVHRKGEWQEYPEVKVFDDKFGQPYTQHLIRLPKHMNYNCDLLLSSEATPKSPRLTHVVCGPNKSLLMRTWLTEGSGFGFEPEIYERYLMGADSLGMYLCFSHNFLDDSVAKVNKIFETDYLNSFMDYLYFSVATISTTGYGDITPIDPKVQMLTVVEIALGWLLLLVFGSLLIAGINQRSS